MSACPSEDELVRMVEGVLAADSLAVIEVHVDGCEPCASVLAGLAALGTAAKPRTADRYVLDRRIAAGGMGEVWAAWDPQLRREVAVKLVRPDRADNGRERARLLREARALAKLTHPNVIAVYDAGEIDGGEVFIATELVVGDTLASRGGASADWRSLVGLYTQAARGLAAAHAVGLVHRDVKPANLLVGADGRVRVADFGLAVGSHTPSTIAPTEAPALDGRASVTQTGAIAGTPAYMAPEQRSGGTVEAAADQYALCVALTESIAGRRPPMDLDVEQLLAFVHERRPSEPQLGALCAAIARGLSLDPDARFPDMTALADALDALGSPRSLATHAFEAPRLGGPATLGVAAPPGAPGTRTGRAPPSSEQAAPPSSSTQTRTLARRRSATAAVLATFAAAAATATVWFVMRGSAERDPSTPPPAVVARTAPIPAAAAAALHVAAEAAGTPQIPAASAAPPRVVARPGARQPMLARTAGGASTAGPPPSTSLPPTLSEVQARLQRRDGKGCRATLAAATDVDPDDIRRAHLEAVCEMVNGNCDAGMRDLRAVYAREGTPDAVVPIIADDYCPIGTDPVVRLRRLARQVDHSTFECATYIAPARAAARDVDNETDRHRIGSILAQIARCYSRRGRCDEARQVLGEAQVFIPAFALNELAPACR